MKNIRFSLRFVIPLLIAFFLLFTTKTSAQTTFRFVSWGDAQDEAANLKATANQALSLNPAFTIFNGDLENDGVTTTEMNTMTAAFGNLFSKTFLVRGNHDNHVSGSASLWQTYFLGLGRTLPSGVTNYVPMDNNLSYLTYSFDYGNSRFIGLDAPGDSDLINSNQYTFLNSRLTDAENIGLTHAFIFFHGPEYCVESTHCSCANANDARCTPPGLISLINSHPIVSATFHGHEHILGWVHMSNTRVSTLTRSYEQFITSPAGGGSYNQYIYPSRIDYYYPNMQNYTQGFTTIDVSGSSFTFSIYKTGITQAVWSKTFTKGVNPTPTPTPSPTTLPTPSPTPTLRPSQTPTSSPTPQPPGSRIIKYYGVDRGNPISDANYSELSKHDVKTIVVDTDIADQASWTTMAKLATTYNFNIVIWPSDWVNHDSNWPNCGWEAPYVKNNPNDYIYKVKPLLDFFYNSANWPDGQIRVIGIVNAHEPAWSCLMTIKEMADIRTQLKNYVQSRFGRNIQVWNYVDNVTDVGASHNVPDYTGPQDLGKIMDVAVTWQHCFGGAEGTCPQAQQKILNDRAMLDSAGLGNSVDLVYLFQTFAYGSGYRMPTATEMHDWSCTFLGTNALDGFLFYSWGACWYNSDLYCPTSTHPNQNLWPVMNNIYDSCVNKGTTTPSPTPTPTIKSGDANGDNLVDELDYYIWKLYYNQNLSGPSNGDFDNSGKVDGIDYVIWVNNYGR